MKKRKGGKLPKKDTQANESKSNISEGSIDSINSINSQREFKNLYWTRVISINNFKEEEEQVFSIEEDYNIEKLGFQEALLDLEREAQIMFDPSQFADVQNALLISDFKLDDDLLREYGSNFTQIRRMFEDQATVYETNMQLENIQEEQKINYKVSRLSRGSKGRKYTAQELLEKQYDWKDFPSRFYKVRKLGMLSALEKTQITHAKIVESQPAEEIARQFRISTASVFYLQKNAIKNQNYLGNLTQIELSQAEQEESIINKASTQLAKKRSIWKAKQIQSMLKNEQGMNVSVKQVRFTLKKQMGLRFRRFKQIKIQSNSERSLVLRQQYALKMMSLFKEKRRIINIDETWLSETNYSRRKWCKQGSSNTIYNTEISPRIAMLTALDTEGNIYYSLTHSNTNNQIMLIFLSRLCKVLDSENWGWRDNTVFLLDGASYHTSSETRQTIAYLDIKIVFSAPYSYDTAPCELLYAHFKSTDINSNRMPTGKKSFNQVAIMTGKRLSEIKRCTLIRFWHHCQFELFKYLTFEKL